MRQDSRKQRRHQTFQWIVSEPHHYFGVLTWLSWLKGGGWTGLVVVWGVCMEEGGVGGKSDALMEKQRKNESSKGKNQYLLGGWKFPQLPSWLSAGVWLLFLPAVFYSGCPLSPARIPHSLCLLCSSLSYRLKTEWIVEGWIACDWEFAIVCMTVNLFHNLSYDLYHCTSLVPLYVCFTMCVSACARWLLMHWCLTQGCCYPPLINDVQLHLSPRILCRLWLVALLCIDVETVWPESPAPFNLATQFAIGVS